MKVILIPKGYRKLKRGTVKQAGDLVWISSRNEFIPTGFIGQKVFGATVIRLK
jgi:hypothetical protein